MLYSTLALTGKFTMEELAQFRQWGSPTPGHPEVDICLLYTSIAAIEQELLTDHFLAQKLYVHQSYKEKKTTDILHILPPYDEYLISYKDRTDVLNKEYQHKAFNSFGIFRPVILYNGQIVGNWNKVIQKQTTHIEMNWFKKNTKIKRELLSLAERRCV